MRHKAGFLGWRTGWLTASAVAVSLVVSGTALAAEPPGYVANQAGATAIVLDTATNATTPLTLPATTNAVSVSPDGATAYFASYAGNALYEVDGSTLAQAGTVALGGSAPYIDGHAVAVTPSGGQVLVAGNSGTLTVINAASGAVAAALPLGGQLRSVAVTPDGAEALLADFQNNRIYIVSLATDQLTATIPVANDPISIQVTSPIPPRRSRALRPSR
jgi:DNA-binding beta-propeller fold protein YncE